MLELPTIAHVTLTVSDLDRSVRWYEQLFDVEMFLDESPGPFRRAVWIVGGQTLGGAPCCPCQWGFCRRPRALARRLFEDTSEMEVR